MRATKIQAKKNINEIFFFLFGMFFLSTEIKCFFTKSSNNSMRALGRKTRVFSGNARADLKQRKKHSGLMLR